MKWFYVIALVVVGLMAASPMYLLRAAEDEQVAGRVVGYNVYGSRVKSIDPATCGDTTSSSIQGNFYEGLYTYHYLKRPLEVVPQLAAGLPEISEDGLTFTIPLKKGVRYARNPCFGYDGEDPDNPEKWGTRTVRAEDPESEPEVVPIAPEDPADPVGFCRVLWTVTRHTPSAMPSTLP